MFFHKTVKMEEEDIVMTDSKDKHLIENTPDLVHFIPIAISIIKTLKTKHINDWTPKQLTIYTKLTSILIKNKIYDW